MCFEDLVDEFCEKLRLRHIEGDLAVSKRTLEILRTCVSQHKQPDSGSLARAVRALGVKFQSARPTESCIGNAVRRVLYIVREESDLEGAEDTASGQPPNQKVGVECNSESVSHPSSASLRGLLDTVTENEAQVVSMPVEGVSKQRNTGKKKKMRPWRQKDMVVESINEYIRELEGIPAQIANQSLDHIHAHEVVMTIGFSETALLFLESTCKNGLDLQVVVAECAPELDGHKMAQQLSAAGVQTTVIPDAAIFAMMARVDQVFIGCKTLLADGGVICKSGAHLVALAAKHYSVPVVVLVGLHKLTPFYSSDPSIALNDFRAASEIVDFNIVAEHVAHLVDGTDFSDHLNVGVVNPLYDYIPGDLISLFITDQGGVTPSYVYRFLGECYNRDDYILSEPLEDLLSS